MHKEYTDNGAINNSEFDWHRQINVGETFKVGGENGYFMLNKLVTPEEFERFMHRVYALQREINLRGELAERDRKMHRLWEKHRESERELATMKGSAAVRLAMGLRKLKRKLTGGPTEPASVS